MQMETVNSKWSRKIDGQRMTAGNRFRLQEIGKKAVDLVTGKIQTGYREDANQ